MQLSLYDESEVNNTPDKFFFFHVFLRELLQMMLKTTLFKASTAAASPLRDPRIEAR
jgi:hypothetical protein